MVIGGKQNYGNLKIKEEDIFQAITSLLVKVSRPKSTY